MTASPVNTRAKQTQMKVSEAVWQLERNMDAQVITVINREPVTAAAPLPELRLVYYVRQHVSDALKEMEGTTSTPLYFQQKPVRTERLNVACILKLAEVFYFISLSLFTC